MPARFFSQTWQHTSMCLEVDKLHFKGVRVCRKHFKPFHYNIIMLRHFHYNFINGTSLLEINKSIKRHIKWRMDTEVPRIETRPRRKSIRQ